MDFDMELVQVAKKLLKQYSQYCKKSDWQNADKCRWQIENILNLIGKYKVPEEGEKKKE